MSHWRWLGWQQLDAESAIDSYPITWEHLSMPAQCCFQAVISSLWLSGWTECDDSLTHTHPHRLCTCFVWFILTARVKDRDTHTHFISVPFGRLSHSLNASVIRSTLMDLVLWNIMADGYLSNYLRIVSDFYSPGHITPYCCTTFTLI